MNGKSPFEQSPDYRTVGYTASFLPMQYKSYGLDDSKALYRLIDGELVATLLVDMKGVYYHSGTQSGGLMITKWNNVVNKLIR